jgi:hypothetical protein
MKICVSGPAVSGKSYFIEKLRELPFVVPYPEAARKTNELFPMLILDNDIALFRKKVCEFQTNIESLDLETAGSVHIFDRGIMDNLTFLFLQEDRNFTSELSRITRLYDDGIIKPYDYIFYFDISPFEKLTPLLAEALNDPLRKATIDINNFNQHIIDFRNTFIEVVNFLDLSKKVVVETAYPDEAGYDKRNKAVKEFILESNAFD